MIFNSVVFIVFIVIVYSLYWILNAKFPRYQNLFLLVASYVFYGYWDYRFLSLIFLSTLVDFYCAKYIVKSTTEKKKVLLLISVIFNLGILGYFKYMGFFMDSLKSVLQYSNYDLALDYSLKIILPVGISFYTFQTMSYTIDVYREKLNPTRDFISFAAFVSFFPQLVAGPIERATNLLPQITAKRKFDLKQSLEGFNLIIWGFFKKIVIADSLAPIVDDIFMNYQHLEGTVLFLGALYFTIQIYCDFSGYSDIAIGLAKLLGINLMKNFNFPYFSTDISDFWRRWHISLSSWFRDYVYIPLGGSRNSLTKTLINITIVFLVSGLWHGANWTFVAWGLFHSVIYIIYTLYTRSKPNVLLSNTPSGVKTFLLFILIIFSWILFRSNSIQDAFIYIARIFTDFSYSRHYSPYNNLNSYIYLIYVLIFFCLDYYHMQVSISKKEENYNYSIFKNALYITIILLFAQADASNAFIYFQF